MFAFTDDERARLNEMRAITTNAQGQEVRVGLTEEETAFYMAHPRGFLTEERDRGWQSKVSGTAREARACPLHRSRG
jgi:hypothetical protein